MKSRIIEKLYRMEELTPVDLKGEKNLKCSIKNKESILAKSIYGREEFSCGDEIVEITETMTELASELDKIAYREGFIQGVKAICRI